MPDLTPLPTALPVTWQLEVRVPAGTLSAEVHEPPDADAAKMSIKFLQECAAEGQLQPLPGMRYIVHATRRLPTAQRWQAAIECIPAFTCSPAQRMP